MFSRNTSTHPGSKATTAPVPTNAAHLHIRVIALSSTCKASYSSRDRRWGSAVTDPGGGSPLNRPGRQKLTTVFIVRRNSCRLSESLSNGISPVTPTETLSSACQRKPRPTEKKSFPSA